jgi:hypothetical protein
MPELVSFEDVAQITSPRIRRLYAYWSGLRRGEGLPRRADVVPDQIKDLLPNIMIVDVEREPLRFRYRLVGTKVVEYNDVEFTGRYLGEIGWPEEADLIKSYVGVVESRRPVFGSLSWGLVGGGAGRSEFARLPLSDVGETVSQILAMEDYDFPKLDAAPSGSQPAR